MKNWVIKICLLLLFSPTVIFSQNEKVKGNKEVVSISEDIPEDFDRIEVSDNLHVEIQKSRRNSFVLTTDENLVDEVEVRVQNGTLRIFTRGKIVKSKKLEVFINSKHLRSLYLNDGAKVKVRGNFESENLEIVLNKKSDLELEQEVEQNVEFHMADKSSAKIDLTCKHLVINNKGGANLKGKLDVEELQINLERSADVKLEGNAQQAFFNVRNNTNLKAHKLKASKAVLTSKNNADIYIRANKSIEIDAQGKSKIYVYGNPEIIVKGLTDKSRIIKK